MLDAQRATVQATLRPAGQHRDCPLGGKTTTKWQHRREPTRVLNLPGCAHPAAILTPGWAFHVTHDSKIKLQVWNWLRFSNGKWDSYLIKWGWKDASGVRFCFTSRTS